MQPKISVIIPVYNTEKYLETCLASIINQTYKNLEIIIINDGSTDSSLEICNKYKKIDKRIKIINQENKGQSVARNNGIKIATGDYLHFMDSDDFIPLNYYENIISSGTITDADMLLAGFYFEKHPQLSVKFENINCYTSKHDKLERTFLLYYQFSWLYLIKKELITKNNIKYPENRIMEDVEFTTKLALLANKIITIPNTQYFYRYNKDSSLNKKSYKQKRKTDKQYSRELKAEILKRYNIEPKQDNYINKIHFKIFGIPLITKKTYLHKKVYLIFNIPIFEIR